MKYLLFAMVAVFLLIAPKASAAREVVASVRFVDHEGNGISGLMLQMHWREDGADPLINDSRFASGQISMYRATTDENGVAMFLRLLDDEDKSPISPDAQAVVYPVFGIPAWVNEQEEDPGAAELERFQAEFGRDSQRERAEYLRHAELRLQYPLRAYYRFTGEELLSSAAVVRVPESVTITFEYSQELRELSPHRPSFQANGAFIRSGTYTGAHRTLLLPKGEPAQIGVIGLPPKDIWPASIQPCFVLEYSGEQTESDIRVTWPREPEELVRFATLHYTAKPWQEAFITAAFVETSGNQAFKAFLASHDEARQDGYEFQVPPGEYLIVRDADWNSPVGPNEWRPGSVFDTMLRLRRGEDLPHLKRITIPEGGTVELSSEDFLDPPAEPEAKDAAP